MAKKILLAEDSKTMQQIVKMTFAAEDYEITAVSNAAEALNQADILKPNVVLVDASLPDKDGYALAESLKQKEFSVILLYGGQLNSERFDESKADAKLQKPFETQALIDLAQKHAIEIVEKEEVKTKLEVTSLSTPIGVEDDDIVIDASAASEDKKEEPPALPPFEVEAKKPSSSPQTLKMPAAPDAIPSLNAKKQSESPLSKEPSQDVLLIEAEPPPEAGEKLPSFEKPTNASSPAQGSALPPPPAGMSLPKPPAGMSLPSKKSSPKLEETEPKKRTLPSIPPPPPPPIMKQKDSASANESKSETVKASLGRVIPVPAKPPLSGKMVQTKPLGSQERSIDALDPNVQKEIQRIAREVIEEVAWQVVPQLAETLIKEELERLMASREK